MHAQICEDDGDGFPKYEVFRKGNDEFCLAKSGYRLHDESDKIFDDADVCVYHTFFHDEYRYS